MAGYTQIFLDIKNRLESANPYFPYPTSFVPSATGKFVYIWQYEMPEAMLEGKWAGVQTPCVFVEFLDSDIQQYSNGTIVEVLTIKIHIVDKFVNSIDGLVNFDQNLRIFDFRDWVYQMLGMFNPTNCGVMTIQTNGAPKRNKSIVEAVQTYKVLYCNTLLDQPINGEEMNEATGLNLTVTLTETTSP